ncbi:MAG: ATP-binding protein, partial [Planctomycetota bacterium]
AAIDGIPSLIIDPKGDMTNLLLQFPELAASDFERWVHPDDAAREGVSVAELAQKQATRWREGLAAWGQSPERIQRLADACDFNIFTPGSDAGTPVSILSSFAAPTAEMREDEDLMRDRISTTATSLLGLLGIDADPIRSREHILLTTIFKHHWDEGKNLDLGGLIRSVQTPPVQRVGVMDLETFFPAKERFELAMAMNNLLASPSFSAWLTGESLDIQQLLYTPSGKPRVSIFYIAHLPESERMFFTSLLLNQLLGWMRSRSGTSSLRALLYIDEIFGFMPPVAEPPSKKPLLTLLKQARAYGVGVILSTQNPVDLDYKGLSNTGTWFLGRLQTERDRERVLDGLQGAAQGTDGSFDRREMSEILAGVGKRVFLLHNVHDEHPVLFQTRWALSYLAGPMTRPQIKSLMEDREPVVTAEVESPQAFPDVHAAPPSDAAPQAATPDAVPASNRPVLPPRVKEVFLPLRTVPAEPEQVRYEPRLIAIGHVHFVDTRKGLRADESLSLLAMLETGFTGVDWDQAVPVDVTLEQLLKEPPVKEGQYADLSQEASEPKNYTAWKKELSDHLYRSRRYPLWKVPTLGEYSEPGETEIDFRIRLRDRAREERDQQVEKLRDRYERKIERMEERVRKAELRVKKEKSEAAGAKTQSMIRIGETILGVVLGRRRLSRTTVGRASTTMRGMDRANKQQEDVHRAEANVEAYEAQLEDLQQELKDEVSELKAKYDVASLELEEVLLKPRRTDIDIRLVALAWAPFGRDAAGGKVRLF